MLVAAPSGAFLFSPFFTQSPWCLYWKPFLFAGFPRTFPRFMSVGSSVFLLDPRIMELSFPGGPSLCVRCFTAAPCGVLPSRHRRVQIRRSPFFFRSTFPLLLFESQGSLFRCLPTGTSPRCPLSSPSIDSIKIFRCTEYFPHRFPFP